MTQIRCAFNSSDDEYETFKGQYDKTVSTSDSVEWNDQCSSDDTSYDDYASDVEETIGTKV